MSAVLTPPAEAAPPLECPPSLRRLAPVSVLIQDANGRQPSVSSGGLLLVAHRRYQVRVIVPADAGDEVVHVSLGPDEHLRNLGPAQELHLTNGRTEYVLSFTTSRLLRPWPVRARITVILNHSRWGNYPHELPVLLWPSMLNRLIWAFGVTTPLWTPYLVEACIRDGRLRPWTDITDKLRDSQELAMITLMATLGIAGLVYAFNFGYQLFLNAESP
jgi:hypothetical protein